MTDNISKCIFWLKIFANFTMNLIVCCLILIEGTSKGVFLVMILIIFYRKWIVQNYYFFFFLLTKLDYLNWSPKPVHIWLLFIYLFMLYCSVTGKKKKNCYPYIKVINQISWNLNEAISNHINNIYHFRPIGYIIHAISNTQLC